MRNRHAHTINRHRTVWNPSSDYDGRNLCLSGADACHGQQSRAWAGRHLWLGHCSRHIRSHRRTIHEFAAPLFPACRHRDDHCSHRNFVDAYWHQLGGRGAGTHASRLWRPDQSARRGLCADRNSAHRQICKGLYRQYCSVDWHHSGFHPGVGDRKGKLRSVEQRSVAGCHLSLPASQTKVRFLRRAYDVSGHARRHGGINGHVPRRR